MKQTIILILCSICLLSCNKRYPRGRQGDVKAAYDTIFVFYHEGTYETSCAVRCQDVKEGALESDISEVIVIDKESYDYIFSFLAGINAAEKRTEFDFCESRVHVQVSEYEMCIGDMAGCGCNIYDNGIQTNDSALYLVLSLSGYYNYLDSLDLQFDYFINKYGIPSTYKKHEYKKPVVLPANEYGECEIIGFDDEDSRKVALVRNE